MRVVNGIALFFPSSDIYFRNAIIRIRKYIYKTFQESVYKYISRNFYIWIENEFF